MTTGRINQVATFILPASTPSARLNRKRFTRSRANARTLQQGREGEPQPTKTIAQGNTRTRLLRQRRSREKSMVITDNTKATPHRSSQNIPLLPSHLNGSTTAGASHPKIPNRSSELHDHTKATKPTKTRTRNAPTGKLKLGGRSLACATTADPRTWTRGAVTCVRHNS